MSGGPAVWPETIGLLFGVQYAVVESPVDLLVGRIPARQPVLMAPAQLCSRTIEVLWVRTRTQISRALLLRGWDGCSKSEGSGCGGRCSAPGGPNAGNARPGRGSGSIEGVGRV